MTQAAPLLDIPEAPVPSNGAAEWFAGAGGARLRAALFSPPGKARGSVVLSPGRTEPIEKYYEVIRELQDRGFVVLVHDWRGQGLSHRLLADRLRGHATGFADFVADYRALLDAFEARLPKPWIAVGHSMGGCLTTLALAHGQDNRFVAAFLSAPMLGLQTPGKPRPVVRALAWIKARTDGEAYIQDAPGEPFGGPFEGNVLTHDPARYARNLAQVKACPDLALGSGTWAWLDFAFSASAWLKRAAGVSRIAIPVEVLGAEHEALVDNADQRAVVARMPQGRWREIAGANHELFQETDAIRARVWTAFDDLADRVAP